MLTKHRGGGKKTPNRIEEAQYLYVRSTPGAKKIKKNKNKTSHESEKERQVRSHFEK